MMNSQLHSSFKRRTEYLARCLLVICLAVLLAGAVSSRTAIANTDTPPVNKAGLVVVHEDGSTVSRCVGFTEEGISGYELLVRGGFATRSEVTAMGPSVCSIDGQGCGDGEDCFCQCKSGPCLYWTYWQKLPDGWRYSNAGSSTVQVKDGDVQGWVWGESSPNAAIKYTPPDLAFADICSADAVVYGIENGLDAPESTAQPNAPETPLWMVALVVAVPVVAGGAWVLLQRRKVTQP
jgi:hypothetical protein